MNFTSHFSRRRLRGVALIGLLASVWLPAPTSGQPPREPLEINHEPQFLFDLHVVDNHWPIKNADAGVTRIFHQPKKHPRNPLLKGEHFGQSGYSIISYIWPVRDGPAGLFRMYYMHALKLVPAAVKGIPGGAELLRREMPEATSGKKIVFTDIAYAESKDGISWVRPNLNIFPDWLGSKVFPGMPNNVIMSSETSTPAMLDVPEKDRRGYRFIMMHHRKGRLGKGPGIFLTGSHDGIRWDEAGSLRITKLPSDTQNTIVYDPQRDEYVMFCRAKHIYSQTQGKADALYSRRVARMVSKKLWTDWDSDQEDPQTILVPDEIDQPTGFNMFYGMPTRFHAGIYWGFLEPFRLNDFIYTELATSRDGVHFDRLPARQKMLEWGKDGAWDDTMILASPGWIEVGNEWWIYYSGFDGAHGANDRDASVGLATIRKEGLISMRGPAGGGMIITRQLRWPGGTLRINANATGGEIKVRVSDAKRAAVDGFGLDDGETYRGDSVSHEFRWKRGSLDALKGRVIRLEFYLENADLYTFRAAPPGS